MVRGKASVPDPIAQTGVSRSPLNKEVCLSLINELSALRVSLLAREGDMAEELALVSPKLRESARNLVHYLALRVHDLRPIQEQLAWLGLSSLGRAESHVLASLDKVLGILHCLTGQEWQDKSSEEPAGSVSSRRLLEKHSVDLLGKYPAGRPVRIMVTLPSTAAADYSIVRELVDAGMDIARINCAHDNAEDWKSMALNVRRAAKATQRSVRIMMDLGGPKIRTGEIEMLPAVMRLRPHRDEFGRVYRPFRLGLQLLEGKENLPEVDASIGVDEKWLSHLKVGSKIDFSDARGAKRQLQIVHKGEFSAVGQCDQTAYLTPETLLAIKHAKGKKWAHSLVHQIENPSGVLHLRQGDFVHVTKTGIGHAAVFAADDENSVLEPAHISCTLPQVIDQVHKGERIWFDDGRIGGVIREVGQDWLEVEITQARDGGEKLAEDKGINLPDSDLKLPALTEKDFQDLQTVAIEADMVGLSFVQQAVDVHALRNHLDKLGRCDIGIVLKIETLKGFENLPELMLAAMSGNNAGVMIARGDLAVECGYERLAEVQEEILWCAEAAHMPVIWATQVLETLAKTGLPSRAEISDAGLGVRAECVMLNKGPYIAVAIETLDDILRRMGHHQAKKRSLLRALRSWGGND
jgi:pyruvate kinase